MREASETKVVVVRFLRNKRSLFSYSYKRSETALSRADLRYNNPQRASDAADRANECGCETSSTAVVFSTLSAAAPVAESKTAVPVGARLLLAPAVTAISTFSARAAATAHPSFFLAAAAAAAGSRPLATSAAPATGLKGSAVPRAASSSFFSSVAAAATASLSSSTTAGATLHATVGVKSAPVLFVASRTVVSAAFCCMTSRPARLAVGSRTITATRENAAKTAPRAAERTAAAAAAWIAAAAQPAVVALPSKDPTTRTATEPSSKRGGAGARKERKFYVDVRKLKKERSDFDEELARCETSQQVLQVLSQVVVRTQQQQREKLEEPRHLLHHQSQQCALPRLLPVDCLAFLNALTKVQHVRRSAADFLKLCDCIEHTLKRCVAASAGLISHTPADPAAAVSHILPSTVIPAASRKFPHVECNDTSSPGKKRRSLATMIAVARDAHFVRTVLLKLTELKAPLAFSQMVPYAEAYLTEFSPREVSELIWCFATLHINSFPGILSQMLSFLLSTRHGSSTTNNVSASKNSKDCTSTCSKTSKSSISRSDCNRNGAKASNNKDGAIIVLDFCKESNGNNSCRDDEKFNASLDLVGLKPIKRTEAELAWVHSDSSSNSSSSYCKSIKIRSSSKGSDFRGVRKSGRRERAHEQAPPQSAQEAAAGGGGKSTQQLRHSRDEVLQLDKLSPLMIYRLVYAVAKLDLRWPLAQELFQKLAENISRKIEEEGVEAFKPQYLVRMAWAYARLRVRDPYLFSAFANALMEKLDDLSYEELLTVKHVFEALQFWNHRFMNAVDELLEQMREAGGEAERYAHRTPRKKPFKNKARRVTLTDPVVERVSKLKKNFSD